MKIGVLALQGDFREHIAAIKSAGHAALSVRRVEELDEVDALILPGGESTTIAKLARSFGVFEPIKERITSGMPVYGSCAGMILLADKLSNPAPDQETFGGIDMVVRRNAFGRQIDSFESKIQFAGDTLEAVFIRAPWVDSLGAEVEVLSSVLLPDGGSYPVAVKQGNLLATSFHPELTSDLSVHTYFFEQICKSHIK